VALAVVPPVDDDEPLLVVPLPVEPLGVALPTEPGLAMPLPCALGVPAPLRAVVPVLPEAGFPSVAPLVAPGACGSQGFRGVER
jgi:hypothetical protein